MASLLSRGVIAKIIEGQQPVEPCLQIISMKRIPSGEQERYRLLVSDGQWTSSFAMLATQLNSMVATGDISNFCVIRLNRYVCNTVQESKKVLIILDLTILQSGAEVGAKIGEPSNFEVNKPRNENPPSYANQAQQARPAASPAAGGAMQRNPLVQRNEPNVSSTSSPTKTPSGGSVHPIASLTPYQNKWTICARVTNKSDIRTWSNSRGEGKLFSMNLLDDSGEIRITGFNEQVDKFYDMCELDKVYFISCCTLKTANKQYSNLNNDYEMTMNRGTEITPCLEKTAIPTMQYAFVPIDQLDKVEKDTIVDVIGICKEASDIGRVTQRATGKELLKRDLQLVDESNHEVRLTLWGNNAEKFDGSLQPVVAVKGARTSDFNGVCLGLISGSSYQLNPDIKEAHKLKGWFENGGCKLDSVNLSNQRGSGNNSVGNLFKTFAEAKLENLGSKSEDKADYYSTKASVVLVRKENCMYQACPEQNCNKKVVDMNNGLFRCEKCNKEHDSFSWRLMLSANLADITDNQWVTFFQDQAETLLGITSQDLGSYKETDSPAFEKVFSEVNFKSFNLRLRVKMETYNDEKRLKSTVAACTPIEPKEYNRRLINEIKQMASIQ